MIKNWLPSSFVIIGLIISCEYLVYQAIIPEFILPRPTQVLKVLFELKEDFYLASLSTLRTTVEGLSMSIFFGVGLASIFSWNDWLKRAFMPIAFFFQTVPIISIAPLLVIWFGFGEPTVRMSAFIVSFFPVLANSLLGFSQVPKGLSDLFRIYGASQWKLFWKLKLPSALNSMTSGLRISSGLAVVGSIVGEFVAGGVLGSLIDSARTQQRVDVVFGAVLLSSILGLFLVACVSLVETIWKKRSEL